MRNFRTLIALGVAGLLLSGCTLMPTNSSPKVTTGTLPFGLSAKSIPGTSGQTITFKQRNLYLIKNSMLQTEPVLVPSNTGFNYLYDEYLAGPTRQQQSEGLRSPLIGGVKILGISVQDGIAYTTLSSNFLKLSRHQQLLFEGALVLVTSQVGAFVGVVVTTGGATRLLPLPDGTEALLLSPSSFTSLVLR